MPLPENVRNYRRRAGLTQEELADAAGHSVGVVRKIEQGGSARVETLHDLARALGVPTSALFETAAPEPVRAREGDTVRLAELRKALMPPVGLVDIFVEPIPVDLIALQRHIDDAHALYHVDRYDSVARTLPGILRESESAVAISDPGSRTRRKALAVRAGALLVTGKYLTQVRRYDLAYHALSRGIVDAREAEQTLTAATGVVGLSWLLLRQDRFDEAESLAASTAAEIEPRMSQATPGQLAAWGSCASEWHRRPCATTAPKWPRMLAGWLPQPPARSTWSTSTSGSTGRPLDRQPRKRRRLRTFRWPGMPVACSAVPTTDL